MILDEGKWRFNFSDAVGGFKFDEQKKESPHFHGLSHCMKAVDFVVELNTQYLFVEVKDILDPSEYADGAKFNDLVKALVTKFRDSFLYRWAENKTDKPVRYLCLVELENALVSRLMDELKRQLPEKGMDGRWVQPIAAACIVANAARWNASFPEWQIAQIPETR